jgi:hypothetical protein
MEMHQIDRTHLAHRDPLLFRELQALCTLCPSKDRCAGDNLSDTMSEASGAYCPNVKTFIALGDRAQKIFLPGTSGDTRLGPQQYYYISRHSDRHSGATACVEHSRRPKIVELRSPLKRARPSHCSKQHHATRSALPRVDARRPRLMEPPRRPCPSAFRPAGWRP